MGKINKIGYSLKDISVVQAPISYQLHRSDVNPFVKTCGRDTYPVFVAPMAAVTDEKNYKTWIDNKLTPVIPRSVMQRLSFDERMEIAKETFVSISLNEAYELVKQEGVVKYFNDNIYYVCIDIAHGTLDCLYKVCRNIKEIYGDNIIIMTGNIANPDAYAEYCKNGIDYVRCSIGSGSRCTSSANVSIHYPLATLLDDINTARKYLYNDGSSSVFRETKIIADGGIGWFDDIQKSLVLGADYVMIGKMFAECEEACAPIVYLHKDKPSLIDAISETDYTNKLEVLNDSLTIAIQRGDNDRVSEIQSAIANLRKRVPFRNYYGMSTKQAQKVTGGDGNKTAEGISKPVEVKYPVKKMLDNMESYLRSCMTYTNSKSISDLKNAEVIILGGTGDMSYRK